MHDWSRADKHMGVIYGISGRTRYRGKRIQKKSPYRLVVENGTEPTVGVPSISYFWEEMAFFL